jgi:hypothetical protein
MPGNHFLFCRTEISADRDSKMKMYRMLRIYRNALRFPVAALRSISEYEGPFLGASAL